MSNFFPNARRPGCIVLHHQIGGSVTLSLSLFIEAYALNGPLQCTLTRVELNCDNLPAKDSVCF